MDTPNEERNALKPKQPKGFISGLIVGLIFGTVLFLLTIQLLYMAR